MCLCVSADIVYERVDEDGGERTNEDIGRDKHVDRDWERRVTLM